jgi:hypothetical protein
MPIWATISAHNLAAFPVLLGIEGITILVDHDKPNPKTGRRAGHEAAYQLIERYTKAGFNPKRDIKVICPPDEGEDVNDLVRKQRGQHDGTRPARHVGRGLRQGYGAHRRPASAGSV